MDKHYLRDLADAGVETIPSRYLECGSEQVSLRQAFFESGWDQAVVKPCVSGAARHTFRIDRGSVREVEEQLAAVMSAESFILQEFQSDILDAGERSLIFFGNEATHAVQKRGRPGDFRVQDDHGGTVVPCQATEEEIEFALRAAKACPEQPVYGRVDFVRDNRGQLSVMELELIEPELWLRFFPDAASRFAEGIVRKLRLAADCPRW
jgi:glutathione synthase/RimK-type ligase-like ATP-grasp enzyme